MENNEYRVVDFLNMANSINPYLIVEVRDRYCENTGTAKILLEALDQYVLNSKIKNIFADAECGYENARCPYIVLVINEYGI